MKRAKTLNNKQYPIAFIIPAAFFFLLFFILPVLMGFGYSLTNWNLRNPEISFVGLFQFKQLLRDQYFLGALGNTFLFAFSVTILQNIIGLALALAMSQKLKTTKYLQAIFFLPYVLSTLIVGYAFKAILHPDGVLNNFLAAIGLSILEADWLNTQWLNMFSIILTSVWMCMGFNMTVFLTGIKSIPGELLEAASIDGASPWQRFWKVTFPMLSASLTINVLTTFIGAMKVFDLVFAMTKGGPGHMTEVLNTLVYRSFGQGRLGYGTAINVVLFILVTFFAVIMLKLMRKREVDM